MAVQAQYPSNILLLNRNVQETNDYSLQQQPGGGGGGGFIDQNHMFLTNTNGVGVNQRKRSREVAGATTTTTTINSFSFSLQNQQQQNQNQNHQLIDLCQLQNHQQQQQQPNVVSTGLRLSFGDQNHQLQQHQQQQQIQQHQQQQSNNTIMSLLSEEFALQFKQQSDELSYFLHSQENDIHSPKGYI